ncbi:hypothetical protein EVJ58_g1044, partial [Rhodofomes roseus]
MNLFGTSPTSHTPHIAPSPLYDTPTYTEPLSASPSSSRDSSRPSLSKRSLEIPKPNVEEESPEEYLHRLTEAVSKSEVAIALASSADPFHARALRAYIEHFNFRGDPLDVAVRKLLMDVGLPRETQQIDRVIEAFAARYVQCNPNLYTSEDHPYILAFSLIMLHTDVFNKHNKRKMTKVDYMKNTRLPGVPPEVLDCFYDNIVFAPFIFIEDPVDANGHRGTQPDPMNARRMSVYNIPPTPGSTTLLGKSNKIDPYYLIARDLLNDLRVNVAAIIPPESPYFYKGTGGSWDEEELLRAFTTARAVAIATEGQYGTTPFFGLSVSGGPGPLQAPVTTGMPTVEAYGGMASVRVTKVGLLQRKDDTVEGGRRAMTRKWREWCVLLTGSHLLFFRDPSWAASIQAMLAPGRRHAPQPVMPQPDEYVSVKDCIAVFDKSYAKHPHTLRLVLPDGRHYLLQAHAEQEMNEWISCVNYASAFKTAGLRMRALGLRAGAVSAGLSTGSEVLCLYGVFVRRGERELGEAVQGDVRSGEDRARRFFTVVPRERKWQADRTPPHAQPRVVDFTSPSCPPKLSERDLTFWRALPPRVSLGPHPEKIAPPRGAARDGADAARDRHAARAEPGGADSVSARDTGACAGRGAG